MAYKNQFPTVILPIKSVLQNTNYTCGPACLKMVLDILNKKYTQGFLGKMAGTNKQDGTPMKTLPKVLRQLGVKCEFYENKNIRFLEKQISALNLCLVCYQAWGNGGKDYLNLESGHYSIIFGYNRKYFYLADPSQTGKRFGGVKGYRRLNKQIFYKNWLDRETKNDPIIKRGVITISLSQKK